MTSICEEQRRLEEEQDLLGTGSGDSAADETELLNMDIDDEDEASLVVHKEPKPSGVGTVDSKSPVPSPPHWALTTLLLTPIRWVLPLTPKRWTPCLLQLVQVVSTLHQWTLLALLAPLVSTPNRWTPVALLNPC